MTQSVIMQFTELVEYEGPVETSINANIARNGALYRCTSLETALPGGTLDEGQTYLVWPSSTWTGGHLGEIAVITAGSPVFIVPVNNMTMYVESVGSFITYTGTSWEWIGKNGVYTEVASGTFYPDFITGNHLFYTMGTSGSRQVHAPVNYLAPGVRYVMVFHNTMGSGSIDVSFLSTVYHGYQTIAVSFGDRAITEIMIDSAGGMNLTLSTTALQHTTPP